MSRTEGVNVRAIPSPSPRYDRGNEAQFRRAMEISLERLNTRIQTVGLEDDETVLNPDADETISGDWTFTGSPSLPESSITDGSILARLADDETVTGTWTFSGTPVVVGSDPGGGETLRVGGNIRASSVFVVPGAEDDDYQLRPSQNEVTGVAVRATSNPSNTNPIFTVESSGNATRFGVTQGEGGWFYNELVVKAGNTRASTLGAGVENIVHHGTGSPSAVGVEGTLHTQDA